MHWRKTRSSYSDTGGFVRAGLVHLVDALTSTSRMSAEGFVGGQRNVYIESYIPGGYHLEIAERNEATDKALNRMKEAALHWDGIRPVREITDLA